MMVPERLFEYIVTETGTAVHLLAHAPLPSRSNIYFLTNV